VITLQTRDDEILCALSLKVRLFSLEQLASTWWSEGDAGKDTARRRLDRLVRAGLLHRFRVTIRPLPVLDRPVASWAPGRECPELPEIAWTLQSRWTTDTRQAVVYIASRRCANQFGGRRRGELKHDYQATHDLGVSAMYLRVCQSDPSAAEEWIGEDMLRRVLGHGKTPDAVLAVDPAAAIRLVLEFGGAYDLVRVREFHQYCSARELPYEIW
jgi:hypothetical protein